MARTYIKLHGAWSGEPFYTEASDFCTIGRNPKNLSETLITTKSYLMAHALETPDEVAELLRATGEIVVVSDESFDTKRADALVAIRERAEEKGENA